MLVRRIALIFLIALAGTMFQPGVKGTIGCVALYLAFDVVLSMARRERENADADPWY